MGLACTIKHRILQHYTVRVGLAQTRPKYESLNEFFLMITECHYIVGYEISVGVNNAMVLNNDLTLTERKLKLLLFSIVNIGAFMITTHEICSFVRTFIS